MRLLATLAYKVYGTGEEKIDVAIVDIRELNHKGRRPNFVIDTKESRNLASKAVIVKDVVGKIRRNPEAHETSTIGLRFYSAECDVEFAIQDTRERMRWSGASNI